MTSILMPRPGSMTLVLTLAISACSSSSSSKGDTSTAGSPGAAGSTAAAGSPGAAGSTAAAGSPGAAGSTAVAGSGNSAGSGDVGSATCSSDSWWTSGEGSSMRPGEACLSCHTGSGAPRFLAAGTVYPTLSEPNDCKGTGAQGAVVVVVDGNGTEHQATVNSAGNFYIQGGSLPTPWSVRVEFDGGVNSMSGEPESGNCNECHTESGSNGAPGRVSLP